MGATVADPAHFDDDLERVFALFPRLDERCSQRGGTLSGGEQQMLAIGRALMSRPRLLLLDEPSLGLAPLLVQQIFAAIRALNERDRLTVFLVEQNAYHALKLAHRGYVMVNGEITLSRHRPRAAGAAGNPRRLSRRRPARDRRHLDKRRRAASFAPNRGEREWIASGRARDCHCSGASGHAMGGQRRVGPDRDDQVRGRDYAGGAVDPYARIIADQMSKILGQTIIVENKPGAGGNISAQYMVESPADGTMVWVSTQALTEINPSAFQNLRWSIDQFTPIIKGIEAPLVFVAHPSVPATTLAEFSTEVVDRGLGARQQHQGGLAGIGLRAAPAPPTRRARPAADRGRRNWRCAAAPAPRP